MPSNEEPTYSIIRYYKDGHKSKVIATGLTRKEAQAQCSDPESSSRTCDTPVNIKHTEKYGAWFDGFIED